MKFGVAFFPTDYAIEIRELARVCEDLGFESLFLPEHTHIPTSRRTPWPGGAELPREYSHTLDPFVAGAAALAVTT
jgi:alkanesulfonate monooxygenase SsuD/methylene tetrahydromethanopterin reductase-like flavin-dependent oxidoreductase (luciferase family)